MRLNVAYASSEKYAKYAYISLMSLFENNKDIEEINVYYIEDNLSVSTKGLLIKLVNSYKRNIKFLLLDDLCSSIRDMKTIAEHHGSMNIYSSLFLTNLSKVDRILAIECDVIVNGSLKELINLDLKDNYLSGLYIPIPKNNPLYKEKYPWFINGGITLQDLNKFRQDNSEQKFIEFFKNAKAIEGAETAFYTLYIDKLFPMPPKFHVIPDMYLFNAKQRKKITGQKDFYSEKDIEEAKNNPILIHYAGSLYGRPWDEKCDHPKKDVFLHYLNMSPWAGQLEKGEISKKNKITKLLFNNLPLPIFLFLKRCFGK